MRSFKQFLNNPVSELKTEMLNKSNHTYDSIDSMMKKISKSHDISGQELHDKWVKKYKITPDEWIKKQ
jgi:hypothetical protein